MSPPQTMTVTLPAGVMPAQQLQVQSPNGQTMIVTVPQGVPPGGQFQVGFGAEAPVPAAAPPPPRYPGMPPQSPMLSQAPAAAQPSHVHVVLEEVEKAA